MGEKNNIMYILSDKTVEIAQMIWTWPRKKNHKKETETFLLAHEQLYQRKDVSYEFFLFSLAVSRMSFTLFGCFSDWR